mmetsp:Transcript_25952/g.50815  ORF Transcript_25952/g.50815 Transcript_25952/m.50815 type:complete len:82 (-) Transcript_25952:21-266(-)
MPHWTVLLQKRMPHGTTAAKKSRTPGATADSCKCMLLTCNSVVCKKISYKKYAAYYWGRLTIWAKLLRYPMIEGTTYNCSS